MSTILDRILAATREEVARRKAAKPVRADPFANQAQGRERDSRGHATHLPVASFADRQAKPRVGNGLAEPHRRIARPEPRRSVVEPLDLRGPCRSVAQDDAFAKTLQRVVVRRAFDLHQIRFLEQVARIGELMRERAVVGQREQAFGIGIEAACRIDARRVDESRERRSLRIASVGELADDAVRLVEKNQHRGSPDAKTAAMRGRLAKTAARDARYCAGLSALSLP